MVEAYIQMLVLSESYQHYQNDAVNYLLTDEGGVFGCVNQLICDRGSTEILSTTV
jgi:hypothetical protein